MHPYILLAISIAAEVVATSALGGIAYLVLQATFSTLTPEESGLLTAMLKSLRR